MARLLTSSTLLVRHSTAMASQFQQRRFVASSFINSHSNSFLLRRTGSSATAYAPFSFLCANPQQQQFQFRFNSSVVPPAESGGCPFSGGSSSSSSSASDSSSGGCPFSGGSKSANTANGAAAADGSSCPMSIGGVPKGMGCPVEESQEVTLQSTLMALGKAKLSGFVSATAVAGYVLAGGTNPLIGLAIGVGTQLQSMSACTANQIWEAPYDALMKRTAKRPLVANHTTKGVATAACVSEMVLGSGLLYVLSPEAAALGALNWFLYVGMYTPLKRVSAINTWFGAIIGGIPPLMGGVAAVGGSLAFTPAIGPAYLLAAYMLVWQIPHFMALSFHCRRDYESAGFKMLAFAHPTRASFYAILLSVIMVAITLAGPYYIGWDTELWYYPVTAVPGAIMIQKSVLFHQDPIRHCRGCFLFSYAYLGIVLLALTMNHVQPMHQVAVAYNWVQKQINHENSAAVEAKVVEGEKA